MGADLYLITLSKTVDYWLCVFFDMVIMRSVHWVNPSSNREFYLDLSIYINIHVLS